MQIRRALAALLCAVSLAAEAGAAAAAKVHVVTLGQWMSVQWSPGVNNEKTGDEKMGGDKPLTIKVRPLLVDGRAKEYVLGTPHEVTERLFIVRRAFRVNDSLPEESTPKWQWQRGGWLLVDRATGRVSPINLPEFDAFYSAASWYRDYAAYCGISDDGKKTYAIVAQIGRRRPVLKILLSNAPLSEDAAPDSACTPPSWQRGPVRVSFELKSGDKQTFAIRGHIVDVVNDAEEEE